MENKKIVLATNNLGKAKEFKEILQPLGFEVLLQKDFAIPEAQENGKSFLENALIKARNASLFAKMPALADDSGICVDALGGQPGIYSARFSGEHGNDQANNQKLLELMQDYKKVEQRTAYYVCALAFVKNADDPNPLTAVATWNGYIGFNEVGSNGFGYDPLFRLKGRELSAAQIPPQLKNLLSHRAKALLMLKDSLSKYYAK